MALKISSISGQRAGACGAFRSVRPRPYVACAPSSRTRRQALVVKAGLFDFLTPKTSSPAVNPRAREISEELIDICSGTAAGSRASQAVQEQIEELVSELSQYSVKNPVRSPLLWGTYEVIYCSKPTAVGGPLKKGAGPIFAPGQVAKQILEEPDTLINEVTFKTFGFIPGVSRQYGQIKPISGDTFVLTIKDGELDAGIVNKRKEFDITRKIQLLYLDDTLRIARFLPSADLTDQEAEESQGGSESQEILFVFQRVSEDTAEDEEEEEPDAEEERPASPVLNLFGGTRRVESLATQVERQVESQRTRKGTQPFFVGGRKRDEEEEEQDDPRAAKQKERAEAQARKQREQEERRAAAERARREAAAAKGAEQARAQKEKEAAAKAKAAQEARERAEAEKAERAARATAVREQLAELAEELKEKQAAAREAQKEAREIARENQSVLKQVQAAEKAITEAEEEVQEVAAALDEAVDARKSAEAKAKQAQQAVKEAEAAYKQKVAAR